MTQNMTWDIGMDFGLAGSGKGHFKEISPHLIMYEKWRLFWQQLFSPKE